jgi:ABC-2 type transport system permease protein
MDAKRIWFFRMKEYWIKAGRYIQYMLNSLIYTVIITVIIAAYYYAKWLNEMPTSFPVPFVLAIIFAFFLTRGQVRTFIKEADLVYLLPHEHKLKPYFNLSLLYSILFQLYYLGILFFILGPLYFKYELADKMTYSVAIVAFVLLKVWNMLLKWYVLRIADDQYRKSDTIVRFTLNFLFVYLMIVEANVFLIIALIGLILFLYLYYQNKFTKKFRLKWETLLQIEQHSVGKFYNLANLFVDVPHLKLKIKKRPILTKLLNILPVKRQTFTFLYTHAFIRTGDYLGIYIRLLLVGVLLIVFIPNDIAKTAISLLILYLSAVQLLSLRKHYDLKLWTQLFPVTVRDRLNSFNKVNASLLLVKGFILALVTQVDGQDIKVAVVTFMLNTIFVFSFTFYFTRKKLIKD